MTSMINLIFTNSVLHLTPHFKGREGCNLLTLEPNKDGTNVFPDGEAYVRLAGLRSVRGRVIVLHSGAPHPNRGLA